MWPVKWRRSFPAANTSGASTQFILSSPAALLVRFAAHISTTSPRATVNPLSTQRWKMWVTRGPTRGAAHRQSPSPEDFTCVKASADEEEDEEDGCDEDHGSALPGLFLLQCAQGSLATNTIFETDPSALDLGHAHSDLAKLLTDISDVERELSAVNLKTFIARGEIERLESQLESQLGSSHY